MSSTPILSLPLTLKPSHFPNHTLKLPNSSLSLLRPSTSFAPFSTPPPLKPFNGSIKTSSNSTFAYVTGPASDPNVSESDPKVDDASDSQVRVVGVLNWGLFWRLLTKHKLRLLVSLLTLVCCSTCTLSMPFFSGRFFEVLIGAKPGSLWRLLSTVGILYALEPILTVLFVTNMNFMWEKVMSRLRAQIFGRLLIQKVEFFDRYKVGEITGLLTSDLGSLKDVVSENVSRDRGFRAFSEASNSSPSTSDWNNMYIICFVPPACTYSWPADAHSICFSR